MKRPLDAAAIVGLLLGGILGMAAAFVAHFCLCAVFA
jgi:hypothetical protein